MIDWRKFAQEWQHYKERLLARWDKLTPEDLIVIAGRREQLVSILQVRYGYSAYEAENAVADWEQSN